MTTVDVLFDKGSGHLNERLYGLVSAVHVDGVPVYIRPEPQFAVGDFVRVTKGEFKGRAGKVLELLPGTTYPYGVEFTYRVGLGTHLGVLTKPGPGRFFKAEELEVIE